MKLLQCLGTISSFSSASRAHFFFKDANHDDLFILIYVFLILAGYFCPRSHKNRQRTNTKKKTATKWNNNLRAVWHSKDERRL